MGQINIEVTHLNFSYEKENPILKDISFAADALAIRGIRQHDGLLLCGNLDAVARRFVSLVR